MTSSNLTQTRSSRKPQSKRSIRLLIAISIATLVAMVAGTSFAAQGHASHASQRANKTMVTGAKKGSVKHASVVHKNSGKATKNQSRARASTPKASNYSYAGSKTRAGKSSASSASARKGGKQGPVVQASMKAVSTKTSHNSKATKKAHVKGKAKHHKANAATGRSNRKGHQTA